MKIFEEKGYRYVKHISTGGEGEVHLIRSVDKAFVAKIVPKLDTEAVQLLDQIRSMNIPNIPGIYEVFNHEGKTIIIRDYIEGNTLYDEIRKNWYFSFQRAKYIILKICDTLRAFHAARPNPIIYRDLKPENVIVTPDGDIRLIDLGIVRYYKQEATRDTVLAGTKGYTAPEVMAGLQSDERSDVYSAGLLLYEMLTGKNILEPPYQVRSVKETNEHLPMWIDAVIAKATDLNQVSRYASISEFVADLENPPANRRKNRKWLLIAAVVCTLVVLVGGSFYFGIWGCPSATYEMLLEIEFDQPDDMLWIMETASKADNVLIKGGMLYLTKYGCNIDFTPKPGMMIHYRVSQPQWGEVGISLYRMNAPLNFESLYYDIEENKTCSTQALELEGLPFKNAQQFVDILFYVTPENDAVYAFAIDEEAKKIQYIACQIPDVLQDKRMYMEIDHFSDSGVVMVDGVYVADGSLSSYLNDHFDSYRSNRERVDAFLTQQVSALPEMVFY